MDTSSKLADARRIMTVVPELMRRLFALEAELAVNLPVAQLRVCHILCQGPCPMSTLGRELGVSLSAMTQIADRLERSKLVVRTTHDNDRRIRCLQLTPRGEKIMRRHDESITKNVLAVLDRMGPSARKDILAALDSLMEAAVSVQPKPSSNGHALGGPHRRSSKTSTNKVKP